MTSTTLALLELLGLSVIICLIVWTIWTFEKPASIMPPLENSAKERQNPPTQRVWIVYNPIKAQKFPDFFSQMDSACRHFLGHKPQWIATSVEDPGTGQAVKALRAKARLVIAAGGDGTVRAVAAGMTHSGVPMGIIPLGTGNLFARNLGMPMDIPLAIKRVLTGQTTVADLAWLRLDNVEQASQLPPEGALLLDALTETEQANRVELARQVNGFLPIRCEFAYLVVAGVGFDGKTMQATDPELKRRVGWSAYVITSLKYLLNVRLQARLTVFDPVDINLNRSEINPDEMDGVDEDKLNEMDRSTLNLNAVDGREPNPDEVDGSQPDLNNEADGHSLKLDNAVNRNGLNANEPNKGKLDGNNLNKNELDNDELDKDNVDDNSLNNSSLNDSSLNYSSLDNDRNLNHYSIWKNLRNQVNKQNKRIRKNKQNERTRKSKKIHINQKNRLKETVLASQTIGADSSALPADVRTEQRETTNLHAQTILFANCGSLPFAKLAPDAAIDDGLLDVIAVNTQAGLLGWADLAVKVLFQGVGLRAVNFKHSLGHIAFRQSPRATVDLRKPEIVEVDGDPIGSARTISVRVDAKALLIQL